MEEIIAMRIYLDIHYLYNYVCHAQIYLFINV